ncbi:hypothetical protein A2U01_0033226, partial [Trifolium medium]|nr:hypothetical protein [Trifolium medium]
MLSIYMNNSWTAPLMAVTIDEEFMDLKSGDIFYSWVEYEYESSINFFR